MKNKLWFGLLIFLVNCSNHPAPNFSNGPSEEATGLSVQSEQQILSNNLGNSFEVLAINLCKNKEPNIHFTPSVKSPQKWSGLTIYCNNKTYKFDFHKYLNRTVLME